MTNDPEYVLMFEAMAVANDCEEVAGPKPAEWPAPRSSVYVHVDSVSDDEEHDVEELPEPVARRAELGDITNATAQPPESRSSEVPPPSEVVTGVQAAEPSEQLQAPTVEKFKEWATASFTSATGVRVELPALTVVYQETNGLLVNAKQAISELFVMKTFKALVCRSPERPDLSLSQEEALGWMLAYATCVL